MRRLVLLTLVLAPGAAGAAPADVTVMPPGGARFLAGQRFDVRVEGRGAPPYKATLTIDGKSVPFTSGGQGTDSTDGITEKGWGGFDARAVILEKPGIHVIRATFTDASGTSEATSKVEVVGIKRSGKPLKNVILMLGDGMGLAHRTAGRLVRHGVSGGQPDGWLAMEQFPGNGLVTIHSLNTIVTDSSPGMACYSTGSHFHNDQQGVFPAHVTDPFAGPRVEYMAEYLHRTRGAALGLVTTADVEDATPAANAVHTADRSAGQGICDDYLDQSSVTGLTLLMGGGRRWFLPAGNPEGSRGEKSSGDHGKLPADLVAAWKLPVPGVVDPARDLLSDFRSAGFTYVSSHTELDAALKNGAPQKLLGLFSSGDMNVALDRVAKRRRQLVPGATTFAVDDFHAPDQPMLDEMTRAALQVLSRSPHGFVLLVEGASIDKQSHAMDAERAVGDVLELDRAVQVARDFAEKRKDTLVLVLADHETAGFSVLGAIPDPAAVAALPPDAAVLSPQAQPARQKALGTYDQAGFPRYRILADGYPEAWDIPGKVAVGYAAGADRFETWLLHPRPVIDSLLPASIKDELKKKGYPPTPEEREDVGFFVRGQAAGRNAGAVHTADDVPISAYSADRSWEAFGRVQTNTDVFFEVMQTMLR